MQIGWIRSILSDSKTGTGSVKRVGFLMACIALSLSTAGLAVAAIVGQHVDAALMGAVTAPLAGLAGYGYVNGKAAEAKRDTTD